MKLVYVFLINLLLVTEIITQEPELTVQSTQTQLFQSFVTSFLATMGTTYITEQVGNIGGGLLGGIGGATVGSIIGSFIDFLDGMVIGGFTGGASGWFIGTTVGSILGFFSGPVLGYYLSKKLDHYVQSKDSNTKETKSAILIRKIAIISGFLTLFALKVLKNKENPSKIFIPIAR